MGTLELKRTEKIRLMLERVHRSDWRRAWSCTPTLLTGGQSTSVPEAPFSFPSPPHSLYLTSVSCLEQGVVYPLRAPWGRACREWTGHPALSCLLSLHIVGPFRFPLQLSKFRNWKESQRVPLCIFSLYRWGC